MTQTQNDILEALNPADYFTLAMDEEIRNDGLSGSYGCVALELSNIPDITELKQRIDELTERFPVFGASLQQRGKRFYWCQRDSAVELFYHHNCPAEQHGDDFHRTTIDQIINHKEDRKTIAPIELHLITSPSQNTFFSRWIHPVSDARGADLILKYLCCDDVALRKQFGQPPGKALVYQQLDKYRWWQKLKLLWTGKRYIDKLDQLKSIQAFSQEGDSKKLDYSIQRLSVEETAIIAKLARKHVGLTGTSLYYIGCLMRALEKLNPQAEGEAYCTPYAFNLRKQRAISPMTGNHVCALFAQAPRKIVQNREALFQHLKQQNSDVIRKQQDYAFLPLMWAGSWLSLQEYGKTLRLSYGSQQERSSFWFSDVGKLDLANNSFPGAEIKSMYHICQVTSPPGLAFLSCVFQNRLTLSYNFVSPGIKPEQIEKLHQLVLAELLEHCDEPAD